MLEIFKDKIEIYKSVRVLLLKIIILKEKIIVGVVKEKKRKWGYYNWIKIKYWKNKIKKD